MITLKIQFQVDYDEKSKLEFSVYQVATGGTNVKDDIVRIYEKDHLVVAIPGCILDLMGKKVANVKNCKILCLEEANKLLSQDFKSMLDRLISHLPETRQILLYSVTFPITVEHFMVGLKFSCLFENSDPCKMSKQSFWT